MRKHGRGIGLAIGVLLTLGVGEANAVPVIADFTGRIDTSTSPTFKVDDVVSGVLTWADDLGVTGSFPEAVNYDGTGVVEISVEGISPVNALPSLLVAAPIDGSGNFQGHLISFSAVSAIGDFFLFDTSFMALSSTAVPIDVDFADFDEAEFELEMPDGVIRGTITGFVVRGSVPEPTTATSLIATLAALAGVREIRHRRRSG